MRRNKLTKPIGKYNILYDLCETVLTEFEATGKKFPVTKYTPAKISAGVVYFIRFTFTDGTILYKLGYTSRTVYIRMETLGIPYGTKTRVLAALPFSSVQTAYKAEQLLHEKFIKYKYSGKGRLANGNSELYICDLLQLQA
ncbi:MAG: GIY-YIG nuclease family protein [Candidatus Roizmanbacteria bacterium]|nr:GIY-YIG nuclease family protein [Candidatus Roizmanbacteria bacterium]